MAGTCPCSEQLLTPALSLPLHGSHQLQELGTRVGLALRLSQELPLCSIAGFQLPTLCQGGKQPGCSNLQRRFRF